MKLLIPILALSVMSVSCNKERPSSPHSPYSPGRVYTGRVIVDMCGNIAVQFTDGTPKGQMGWSDGTRTYDNIFKVANSCTWRGDAAREDVRFRFVSEEAQDCYVCAVFVPLPDTAYSIQVID